MKLIMVFYLFIVTFVIYATYGLQSFEDLFTYGAHLVVGVGAGVGMRSCVRLRVRRKVNVGLD